MSVHTYVINLARSKDRRIRMERQLARTGLDYEFVDAVDGRELSADEWSTLVDLDAVERHPDSLTPGLIGCTLSHKRVYDLIADSDHEVALVLEDDTTLPAGIAGLVDQLAGRLSDEEIMLLNFAGYPPAVRLRRAGAIKVGGHEVLTAAEPHRVTMAAAYLIGRQTATAISEIMLPARWPPDWWGAYVEHGVVGSVRCVLPQPVKHDITARSTRTHGPDDTLRQRIVRSNVPPLLAIRVLNRHRIRRRQTRIALVD